MPTFAAPDLQRLTEEVFHAVGFPRDEAATIAEIMVQANLVGHDSHGVIHIPGYVGRIRSGHVQPGAPVEVVHETSTTAVLDGHFTMGHVAASKAMQVAIGKAREHAVAAVGVHNLNHIGRIGAYPQMAAEAGLGAIVTASAGGAGKFVAPFLGMQPRLATNPIAMAFPNPAGAPLLLDMATSAAAAGKIRLVMNRGQETGTGWIINKDGQPTRDPADFYAGGMALPLGGDQGHKGYGLAVMVEVLSGILARTGTAGRGPRATQQRHLHDRHRRRRLLALGAVSRRNGRTCRLSARHDAGAGARARAGAGRIRGAQRGRPAPRRHPRRGRNVAADLRHRG